MNKYADSLIINNVLYRRDNNPWNNINKQQALTMFEEYLKRLHNCSSTAGKRNNGSTCISLLFHFPNLPWDYDDNQSRWDNRFIPSTSKIERPKEATNEVPNCSGVYLVGSTYFNPITDEKFYWIKVGKSVQLNNRMKQYATHNPMLWKNSFWPLPKERISLAENACQNVLETIGIEVAENTDEWYRVSRKDYLTICQQGFDFFKPMIEKYKMVGLL